MHTVLTTVVGTAATVGLAIIPHERDHRLPEAGAMPSRRMHAGCMRTADT